MSDSQQFEVEQPASGAGRSPRTLGLAMLALLVVVAATFLVIRSFGGDSEVQVTLRSLGSTGDDPFTEPVAPGPSATLADYATRPASSTGQDSSPPSSTEGATLAQYRTVSATVPGVFGGSLDEQTCDADQLVRFLTSEPDKARVWAGVLGMDIDDIGAYVDALTGVHLGADTRVLDHGFSQGKLVTREAVLQRGTAVLVDARGVPRVDCYSGNPLRQPTVDPDERFVGTPWPSFSGRDLVVIQEAERDVAAFELVDIADGTIFTRPVGSTGDADAGSSSRPATTTPGAETGPAATPAPVETGPPAVTRELTIMDDIETNDALQGEIDATQDELIYNFDAPDGAKLVVRVANDRASIGSIGVDFRRAGDRVTFFRVSPGGSESFPLTLDHDDGGAYEVVISEGPGAFDLVVEAQTQDDAGEGRDAGPDFDTALDIDSGQRVRGHLAGLDGDDAYRLDLTGAPALVFTARADRGSDRPPAFEFQHRGESIEFFRVNPADEAAFELLFGTEDQGELELYVTEGPAEYEFTAELIPQRDGDRPGDAAGELADARALGAVESFAGEVGDRDGADYFLIEAPADEFTISVETGVASRSRLGVDVLGPDGVRLDFFRVEPGATGSIDIQGTEGDRYRIVMTEGRASYEVTIS